MLVRKLIPAFLLILISSVSSLATHLRAGEITVTRESCTSLNFIITITVYTNTGSEIRFGDGVLDFGDGSTPLRTPTIQNTIRPDLGPNVGIVTFSTTHTYAGPGQYIVSYNEPNRNAGILNMFNSVDTKFYIESKISIDPFIGCDNSPRLLVPPIDKACSGAAFYHNPGAYDPDGDSLSYEFTIPKREKGIEVNNYRDPNVKEFYDRIGLNYSIANEDKDGTPTFTINKTTGNIIWDAPGAPGEYNIAFIIKEWRKIAGVWVNMGYVIRDMQIIVDDCKNKRPELQVHDLCVEAGKLITTDFFGYDPDGDSVKIEAFSQILNQNVTPPFPSPATYTPFPVKYQASGPSKLAKLSFRWQTACVHVREQPYQVTLKITDSPPKGAGAKLVQFKTVFIKVVAPAPVWKDAQVVPANRTAKLEWKPYACSNAEVMQVWRRVDTIPFTPVDCVTGIPASLGYTMIAQVPASNTKYTDTNGGKGLARGAKYCYRLVAAFPLPNGGVSYVSRDTCLPPIIADAPIITNVTVDKTSPSAGQITVKWRPPLEINQAQYPPPYRYKVYRAEGLTGNIKIAPTHPGTIPDTSYVDTGMNSQEIVYNYRVELYYNTNVRFDSSEVASAVRLEAHPQFKQIQLIWGASVPWSNQSTKFPRHLVYRGPKDATESQLILIDSVDVTTGRFTYIDSGQYDVKKGLLQKHGLSDQQVYCYRVMTRGTYGNKRVKDPLVNFSEINCAQPNDTIPPCKQEMNAVASGTQCDQYFATTPCAPTSFTNIVTWKKSTDAACRLDITGYNLYVAKEVGADFDLYVENIKDTFYIDSNLPSYARCYKIEAVDRAGNKSELSEQVCFDNCPHYELPNVFTPNDDKCNDFFSAFSDRQVIDESGNGPCGPIDPIQQRLRCARFVQSVEFTVNNRWGKEVYRYQSGGENTIYIDWDGKDNDGKELAAGVYYYNAHVIFNVVDPAKRARDIRGWVQIIR